MMTIMSLTDYLVDADCPELVNAFNGPSDNDWHLAETYIDHDDYELQQRY